MEWAGGADLFEGRSTCDGIQCPHADATLSDEPFRHHLSLSNPATQQPSNLPHTHSQGSSWERTARVVGTTERTGISQDMSFGSVMLGHAGPCWWTCWTSPAGADEGSSEQREVNRWVDISYRLGLGSLPVWNPGWILLFEAGPFLACCRVESSVWVLAGGTKQNKSLGWA